MDGTVAIVLTPSRASENPIVFVRLWPEPGSLPAGRHGGAGPAHPAPPTWQQQAQAPDLGPSVLPSAGPSIADLLDEANLGSPGLPGLEGSGPERPLAAASVDDPVAVIRQPAPRYPPALALAGLPGRVELEYVVDTLGRAEPASLSTLASTHPAFEAAARAAVLASRFRPARLRGQAVRQLVRQTLSFRSER